MSQYWKIYIHLVWGTWQRKHTIRHPLETVAHEALRTTANGLGLVPVIVNSAWNHTHQLLSWNPSCSIESAVSKLKTESAERVEAYRLEHAPRLTPLRWQTGYAAFSVNPGGVERVKQYIARQKDLHRSGRTVYAYEGWLTTYDDS